MTLADRSRVITDLGPGDHLCYLYDTEDDHRLFITQFLRQGLERGERVVYLVDSHTPEAILSYLRSCGVPVDQYLADGQLSILSADVYLQDELLDPDRAIASLKAETERTLAQGYSGLRATAEMSWVLRNITGSEQLIEYEAKVNTAFRNDKLTGLCQYDLRRFEPAVLLDVISTHPVVAVGTVVHDNYYYIPPTEFLGPDRPKATLCNWLKNLAERTEAEAEMRDALDESQLRRAETAALLGSSRAILEYHEFKDAARAIYDSCKNLLGATAGYLAILNEDISINDILFFECDSVPHNPEPLLLAPMRGLREEACRTCKPVFGNDFSNTISSMLVPKSHINLNNVLIAPLTIKGKVVGLLGLANKQGGFTEKDARMAAAFGELAVVALNNSRTMEALENSEQRFRSVAESASDAIISVDSRGNVVLWNHTAEEIFGYSADEIIGKPFTLVVPEEYREGVKKGVDLLVAQGKRNIIRKPFEATGVTKDGCQFPAEISFATWNTTGEIFLTAIVRDITKRKQMVGAMSFLVDASKVLDSSLDYETTLQGVARLAVPTLADLCVVDTVDDKLPSRPAVVGVDKTKEEMIQANQLRYPMHQYRDNSRWQVLKTGRSEVYPEINDADLERAAYDAAELEALRAMGLKSVMIVPLIARERPLGVMFLASSESGRHYGPDDLALAEDLARHAALAIDNARLYHEAQEAIRLRDEFLSVAAHELRTPITSLRGFAQLLIRHLDRDSILDPLQTRRALGVIDQQSKKLSYLVSQLLDISRFESGVLALDRKITDIGKLIEYVVMAARTTTSQHIFKVQANPEVRALIDPLRIEQVLTNLIDNAIKYSPDGGEIDVELLTGDHQTLQVAVTDCGIGIPPQHREHVFDRFYQAHAGAHSGMGLGLYISKQIVDLHGGRISVEFPTNGGTRFVVVLPTGLTSSQMVVE